MRRHRMLHFGERPYECPICQKRFTQKIHVKSHMIIHMENQTQYLLEEEYSTTNVSVSGNKKEAI